MQVHHLNAGTLCPLSARLVNGRGGLLKRGRLVCHILLVETGDGLLLVDTGLGLADIADPGRHARRWLRSAGPKLDPAEAARSQVEAFGYRAEDVRHIVLTHLDHDHAGGLEDFPQAAVHVHRREHQWAVGGKGGDSRHVNAQWRHHPDWRLWDGGGEPWFGFVGVRPFSERTPEIVLIPLPGHTPGHCGVAVQTGDRWLLHAGDSFFFSGQIETPLRATPPGLAHFQRSVDHDRGLRIANQERLRALQARHGDVVTIINSHDPDTYDHCRQHAHESGEAA
jgi:glyoxylase-like metal-dependent hydrolase (beta-lactamase superfamily II)